MIPYGRQFIDEDDIRAVTEVLRSDWLTTGPKVAEFEQAVADYVGAKYAVAVSNGTAALHAAMYAIDIKRGDEVIVPPITFAATANCIVYQGGIPVFADVDPDTLLIEPAKVEEKITEKTRAIIGVDYAGQPCDWDRLRGIADRYKLKLIADGCHAIGAKYKGRRVGSLADMTIFSFHPVKHITTGEGGMVTTDNTSLAERIRIFRNHGITSDHRQREEKCSWFYEMVDLGFNYRLSDLQCALGISQLRKIRQWIRRRQEIARLYDTAFYDFSAIKPLAVRPDISHAYHLYVIMLNPEKLKAPRHKIFSALRQEGLGVNVHYFPVHLHQFIRRQFHTMPGLCPVAEAAYERLISLPLFPAMKENHIQAVIEAVSKVVAKYQHEGKKQP
jgi:perosamine synthetase